MSIDHLPKGLQAQDEAIYSMALDHCCKQPFIPLELKVIYSMALEGTVSTV